jgi:hypothetical protein
MYTSIVLKYNFFNYEIVGIEVNSIIINERLQKNNKYDN